MRMNGLRFMAFAGVAMVASSWTLAGCGSSQTNNLAPPPRPPDPAQLTLAPIRVARPTWSNPAANPSAPTTPATPTGGRGRRPTTMSMSPELAAPVLAGANEAVRACYKGMLALSPQAAGSVTTLMRVAPDGSVSDVEPIGNTDPSMLLMMPCVLNAVRARRFPATRSSSLLSYPFVFRSGEVGGPTANLPVDVVRPRPGEIPVPNPEPITVRPWRPTLVPNTNPVRMLTRDMAAEARPDITSLVDTCYGAALAMVPDMAGQFGLRIAVEPSGNVSRVEVQDQNSLAGPFRECVIVLGRRLQFHSSGGGAVVSVDISLSQTDGPAPSAPVTPLVPGAVVPGGSPAAITGPIAPATIGAPSGGGLMPMTGSAPPPR